MRAKTRSGTKSKTTRKSAPRVDKARANQAFIVSTILRKGFAEDLNEQIEFALENEEIGLFSGKAARDNKLIATTPKFAPDDKRLTDEICQAYADALADAPSEDDDFFLDYRNDHLDKIILKIARAGKKIARSSEKTARSRRSW